MTGFLSPVAYFRALTLVLFVVLAGCATPRAPQPLGGGDPHYKVGAPYKVNGRWYHPKEESQYEAVGTASWYGEEFHGRRTANGEVFDKERLSAAHTTLPMPSLVEVKNLENGRTVVVRVNDRGPFVGDRLIDMSRAAAEVLDFREKGLAKVRVRYLGRADLYAKAEPGRQYSARMRRPEPEKRAAKRPAADKMASLIETALAAPREEFWIAVGAFDDLNALEAARIALPPSGETRIVSALGGETVRYELQIGPEFDAESADARLAALREAGYPEARIVNQAL
jgi:rare lipoprotein A